MNQKDKVISILLAEEGYLEKKSNKNLDDKYANAGANNYTKYARDIHFVSGFILMGLNIISIILLINGMVEMKKY